MVSSNSGASTIAVKAKQARVSPLPLRSTSSSRGLLPPTSLQKCCCSQPTSDTRGSTISRYFSDLRRAEPSGRQRNCSQPPSGASPPERSRPEEHQQRRGHQAEVHGEHRDAIGEGRLDRQCRESGLQQGTQQHRREHFPQQHEPSGDQQHHIDQPQVGADQVRQRSLLATPAQPAFPQQQQQSGQQGQGGQQIDAQQLQQGPSLGGRLGAVAGVAQHLAAQPPHQWVLEHAQRLDGPAAALGHQEQLLDQGPIVGGGKPLQLKQQGAGGGRLPLAQLQQRPLQQADPGLPLTGGLGGP